MISIHSCEKDKVEPNVEVESDLTKNPIFTSSKMLKGYSETYTGGISQLDSIIYDTNKRVKYIFYYYDKYTFKYYKNKIAIYKATYGDAGEGKLAYSYKLNDNGLPIERINEALDWELGPDVIKFGYNGNQIKYMVETYNNPISKDSTEFTYTSSNIIKSITYRNNSFLDEYDFEYDAKVNPYRGLFYVKSYFSVENFLNVNNYTKVYIKYSPNSPNVTEQSHYFTYNSYNMPIKEVVENNTYFYTYY